MLGQHDVCMIGNGQNTRQMLDEVDFKLSPKQFV